MRRHGWSGDLPADDEEAIRRIIAATRKHIDRDGDDVGIADVARALGVSRATVYRYFATTEDLLTATAIDASAAFLEQIATHLGDDRRSPADAVVEVTAFTLEQLPTEPYLSLLLAESRISMFTLGVTSPVALALGRSFLEQLDVDWSAHGIGDAALDEIVEQMLRMTQSFILDPGSPPRSGAELRSYLTRWLGSMITQMAHDARPGDHRETKGMR